MLNVIYKTIPRRIIMRFVEIFVVSGAVGVLETGLEKTLIPALWVGAISALVKALRELLKKRKERIEEEPSE